MFQRRRRTVLAAGLILLLVAGIGIVLRTSDRINRVNVTAYFANTNGLFVGDEVRILGVPVGNIEHIVPLAQRVRVDFWYDGQYKVPGNANAVVLSPSLVTSRAIQLTPAYTSGPVMADEAVIPQDRTAVPVEWDDFREQLEKLTETLQPTQPGGVSTLGAFISTTANNLRGQGSNIHDTIVKLSQAFSALGDHSKDLFSTVKNLSILVSALQSSTGLMRHLNEDLASVTTVLSNRPNEVGDAVAAINSVIGDVKSFVADNRESLGTTSDKLASVTTALTQSSDDIKQALHVVPNTFQNFVNIYQPAQGTLTGVLSISNFANPISFICGAVQAASRLGAEQSSKLCVQYLAPIIKNRQMNFPPLGENLFVGTSARPNEITYSEDWMRPDYVPPPTAAGTPSVSANPPDGSVPPADSSAPGAPPLAAEAPPPPATGPAVQADATDPSGGLAGLMVPSGAGS
jgi:phospholipid/cholesterol/gamma-HCH transport system substrate-binding protein